jgi:hypothetical protein
LRSPPCAGFTLVAVEFIPRQQRVDSMRHQLRQTTIDGFDAPIVDRNPPTDGFRRAIDGS